MRQQQEQLLQKFDSFETALQQWVREEVTHQLAPLLQRVTAAEERADDLARRLSSMECSTSGPEFVFFGCFCD